jgi:translation initiation factor 2 beta subunit (eIF-2beta)/eIF-5
MKRIVLIFFIVSMVIMIGRYSNKPNLENAINKPNLENPTEDSSKFDSKELVDIYTIAFDSFAPRFLPKAGTPKIYKRTYDYLAINMRSKYFDNISQEGKQQILDYFKNKYDIEVMNESPETLREKGLATMFGSDVTLKGNGKVGILLEIDNEKIVSKTERVIDGYWIVTPVSAEFFRTTIVFKDGQWKLQKIDPMGVS